MGAAAEVLADATGRDPRWLSGQFVSFARPGEVVTLEVAVLAAGGRFTQARVVGHVHGRDVLHVAATLGRGGGAVSGTWVSPPRVEPPHRCPARPTPRRGAGTITERLDVRLACPLGEGGAADGEAAPGRPGPGRSAYWARAPELGGTPAALAVLGDLIPAGVVLALDRPGSGSSLDHAVRVHRDEPATWLLVDVRTHAIEDGVAHAVAHLFDEAGRLRGTASQTTVVRLRSPRTHG